MTLGSVRMGCALGFASGLGSVVHLCGRPAGDRPPERPQRGVRGYIQAPLPGILWEDPGEATTVDHATIEDGHHAVVIAQAILRSHRQRAWVDVTAASDLAEGEV